jgi:hypothetical protein
MESIEKDQLPMETRHLLTDVYSDLMKYRDLLKLEIQEIRNSETSFLDYLCQEKIDKVEANLEAISKMIRG